MTIWYAWPIVWSASSDARIVEVFSMDEGLHLRLLTEAVHNNTLNYNFGNYGHFYFNAAYVILFSMKSMHIQITEQVTIVVLRLLPIVFFCGTIALIHFTATRFFGAAVGWIAALGCWLLPTAFTEMSVISHPDTPQVFFIVAAIYCCCRMGVEGSTRWLIYTSICAGLAFATKYAGIFLLPLIWGVAFLRLGRTPAGEEAILTNVHRLRLTVRIVGFLATSSAYVLSPDVVAEFMSPDGVIESLSTISLVKLSRIATGVVGIGLLFVSFQSQAWRFLSRHHVFVQSLWLIVLSGSFFAMSFLIVSPFSLYKLIFFHGLLSEAQHTSFGHLFSNNESGLTWLKILISDRLVSPIAAFFLLVTLIPIAVNIRKIGASGLQRPESIMWIWILSYLIFLILRVKMREERYLLPILPLAFVLVGYGVSWFFKTMKSNMNGLVFSTLVIASLCAGSFEVSRAFQRLNHLKSAKLAQEVGNDAIRAGKWLEKEFTDSTRILYDRYSYIPKKFQRVYGTSGGELKIIDHFVPDVIVVNNVISNRFQDSMFAQSYRGGEEEFLSRYSYYKNLANGGLPFDLVRNFGTVRIFVRSDSLRIKHDRIR